MLLTGRWDCGGNLVVEASKTLPDDTPDAEADAAADALVGDDANGWAASFLVDTHRAACQEAYETYVEDEGGRLIDNVHGIEIDASVGG